VLTTRAFSSCLNQAMRTYGVRREGLDQRDLLPTAVLLADLLVGALPRKPREARPILWAAGMRKDAARYWARKQLRNVHYQFGECLVDIYVCGGKADPYRPILSIECEGHLGHAEDVTHDASSETCDYLWDLFKLLQVRSPIRVFLALTTLRKLQILEKTIERVIRAYARDLGKQDVIFTVVLPGAVLHDKSINLYRWVGNSVRRSSLPPTRQ
jgi:hypothetical protein